MPFYTPKITLKQKKNIPLRPAPLVTPQRHRRGCDLRHGGLLWGSRSLEGTDRRRRFVLFFCVFFLGGGRRWVFSSAHGSYLDVFFFWGGGCFLGVLFFWGFLGGLKGFLLFRFFRFFAFEDFSGFLRLFCFSCFIFFKMFSSFVF